MEELKRRQRLDTALSIVLVFLVVLVLFIVFRQNTRSDITKLYDYQMSQKDSAIASRDEIIDNLRKAIIRRDTSLSKLIDRITDLRTDLNSLRNNKTIIIREYENIAPSIRAYGKDEFWRRFMDTASYER